MSQRLNLKGPGKCIFCGRGGMSKEHVLPKWLKRILPPSDSHVTSAVGRGVNRTLPLHQSNYTRQGSLMSRKVQVVCRVHCNNGWMGKLEEQTKPILIPLISGLRHTMVINAQSKLATWFAKTTMSAEFFYPGEIYIPQEQRTVLMEKQRPPDGWQIWIAPLSGIKWSQFIIHFGRDDPPKKESKGTPVRTPDGSHQITFIGLRDLLVHIFSTTDPDRALDLDSEPGSPFKQIWPVVRSEITFPFRRPLSDFEVEIIIIRAASFFNSPFLPS